jgi:hypothetical protein
MPAGDSFATLDDLIASDQALADQSQPADQVQPAGSVVSFLTQGVQPPSTVYITRSDRLRVTIWNSAAGIEVDVGARLLRADGNITVLPNALFPTSNRASNTFDLDMAEGFLLSVCATTPTGSVKRGQCWVSIALIRGSGANATVHQSLILDYVETGGALQWPGGVVDDPVSGNGRFRVILGTQPLAGQNILETVPTGARWKVLTFQATLTTAAGGVNRTFRLRILDSGNDYAECGALFSLAGGSTANYVWLSGVTPGQIDTAFFGAALPTDTLLSAGGQLNTVTININAGDQWSAPTYSLVEWVEPA